MATQKLTKRAADNATPGPSTFVIYDTELRGFGLRVTPTGFKAWVVEYRAAGSGRAGHKKRITLGPVTVITADKARQRAKDALAAIRGGHDPLADRAKHRANPSLSEVLRRFLVEHAEARRKPSTAYLYQLAVNRYIVPALGDKKAIAVSSADVLRLHSSMSDKPTLANRVIAALSSAYSWAGKAGLVPKGFNPAAGVEKNREAKRQRFLSVPELERLGAALRKAETTGLPRAEGGTTVFAPHTAAAFRLLILTGCRLREILHARWDGVDFERGVLTLADSKTGQRPVLLNAPALSVLDSLDRIGTFVIPGQPPKKPGDPEKPRSDLKRPWDSIRSEAKLSGVRLHDLRHSFASVGAGTGLGLPIIGRLLGHTRAVTTERYAHLADDPLRRATDSIGATISAALDGSKDHPSVVSIRGSKPARRG